MFRFKILIKNQENQNKIEKESKNGRQVKSVQGLACPSGKYSKLLNEGFQSNISSNIVSGKTLFFGEKRSKIRSKEQFQSDSITCKVFVTKEHNLQVEIFSAFEFRKHFPASYSQRVNKIQYKFLQFVQRCVFVQRRRRNTKNIIKQKKQLYFRLKKQKYDLTKIRRNRTVV